MFIPDMPDMPPQNVSVMIAQANQAQAGTAKTPRTIGVCAPSPSHHYSLENVIEPIYSAQSYFRMIEKSSVTGPATVTILQQPKHGVLRLVTEADGDRFGVGRFVASNQLHVYLPDANYVGKDSATLLVNFVSVKVTVKYYFQAINGPVGDNWIEDYCIKTGVYWKISANLDIYGNNIVNTVKHLPAYGAKIFI